MARVERSIPVLGAMTLLLVLFTAPMRPARAGTLYSGSIVSWNKSGWMQNKGSIQPADVLASNIKKRSPLPTAIVVNEMCDTQYTELVKQLGYAYQSVPDWSLPNFYQPKCTQFGNAVFYLGPKDEAPKLMPYTTQQSSDQATEQRNLTCVLVVRTSSAKLRVCGTHLHPDDTLAAGQLSEAGTVVNGYNNEASPTTTVLIGDLNMTPGLAGFNGWYASYSEGDLSGRTRPRATTSSNVKLDYGFVPKTRASITTTSKIEPQWLSSDHYIYTTYFTLKS